MERTTRMSDLAEDEGFIVAYPQGFGDINAEAAGDDGANAWQSWNGGGCSLSPGPLGERRCLCLRCVCRARASQRRCSQRRPRVTRVSVCVRLSAMPLR
jgi:hypothetical protein